MSEQDRLHRAEQALVRAYDSGDEEAVRVLAGEVRRLRESQRGPAMQPGAARTGMQFFAGFNEGLDNTLQTVSRAGRLVTDRGFEAINAATGRNIFPTDAPSARPVAAAQRGVTGQDYSDLPAESAPERVVRRVGQEVAYAAPAAAAVSTAARGSQAVNAVQNARNIPQALVAPALQQAARTPGAFAAAEGGSALASGVGAGVGREVGGDTGEIIGQIATPMAAVGAAAGVRSALRGPGRQAQQAAARNVQAFERAGTSPTVGQAATRGVGEPSGAARVEGLLSRTPGGVSQFRRTMENQQDAIAQRVEGLARNLAPDARPEGGGQAIQQGIRNFVSRSREQANRLYARVDELIPDSTPAPMTNTRQIAQDILQEAPSGSLADDPLINDGRIRALLQRIASDEPRTYRDLRLLRTRVGRLMNNQELVSSRPEVDRLYGALTDDIADVARSDATAEGAEQALSRANRFYRARQTRIDEQLQPIMQGDRAHRPEDVFRYLERGTRDGATRVRAIRRSVTDDEWAPFSAAVLRRMGTANPSQQGAEGLEFSTETFLTNWNRLSPEARQALFGGSRFRNLRRDLDAIAQASETIRGASRAISNPSGTGEMVLNLTALTTGGGALASGNMTLPALILGGMLSSNTAGRLMTNRSFVRWLAQSTKVPSERLPSYLSRLTGTVNDDPAYAADVAEYIAAVERLAQNAEQDVAEGREDRQQEGGGG